MPEGADIASGTAIGSPPDTLGGLVGMNDYDTLTKELTDAKRQEVAAKEKVTGEIVSQLSTDQARAQQAAKEAAFDPSTIKPWNADEEAAKRRTDPLEAFGSFGSVFGILASLFTHAPMMNAMNASAAAMNAIKEGDALAYDRAHKAWEENWKLALEKHKIQHEAYVDAMSLMQTNLAAGEAKLRVLASRFGDQQTLYLLEHGLSADAIKLMDGRQKLAAALSEQLPKVMEDNAKISRLLNMEDAEGRRFDTKNPNAPQNAELLKRWERENIELEKEKRGVGRGSLIDQEHMKLYQRAKELEEARLGRVLTPDEESALQDKYLKKGAGSARVAKPEEKFINERAAQYEKEGMKPADALSKAQKEWKEETRAITANRADEITGKINRVDNMLSTIDKTVDLLKKHKAITGLGGTVTRPAEVVSNIFGGNETDRKQFERYVLELQEWAPAALNDRNGRPLSAEAGKINGIIAGLRLGDTTANTARAYAELVPLLEKIKKQLHERIGGTPTETATPAEAAPAKPKFRWQDAPEVGAQ